MGSFVWFFAATRFADTVIFGLLVLPPVWVFGLRVQGFDSHTRTPV